MADGVPSERRATPCRGDGSDRKPTDHTVALQKQITALADAISQVGVLLATLTITFALSNNKSAVGANKGVNIHRDTRSGGDTDDTVIRVVVVTVVDCSDISGESVGDF